MGQTTEPKTKQIKREEAEKVDQVDQRERTQPAIQTEKIIPTMSKIPRILPPCQNYSRSKKSKNGTVGREEWLSMNEVNISDMWKGLKSYLKHCNTNLLDKCTYVDFSDFVARYSTHFAD